MTIGPVMIDLKGPELSEDDVRRLSHPLTGGVILFTRNYRSPAQLAALTQAIRAIKTPSLLIGVDQEGGRVQRFRDGFTRMPSMGRLGRLWDQDQRQARKLAREVGYVLGAELRAHGVDFSFTPVLDIHFGNSRVIGDRAFHRDPQAVGELAHHLQLGLRDAGMETVGKHFPGHGYAQADSHIDVPVDERDFVDIELSDLIPFKQMINFGMTAVMPAHVIYPKVDSKPAGFSNVWLQDILRGQMQFEGVIFSDDLSMEGARTEGGIVARAGAALQAGCDMVLVCNKPVAVDELLAHLQWTPSPLSVVRLTRMRGGPHALQTHQLWDTVRYRNAVTDIGLLAGAQKELALGIDPTAPRG